MTIALATALVLTVPVAPAPSPAGAPSVNAGAARHEVYRLHLSVDVPVTLLAGTLPLLRIVLGDRLVRTDCPCDPSALNALDRGTVGNDSALAGTLADATVYGTMAVLPLLDLVDLGANRALAQDLVVYVETLAVNSGLQNLVNFVASRPRPRTYDGDPDFVNSSEGYLSFYAGHVSTAFAALSAASFTVQRRYRAGVWPWIVTAVVGGSVAVERVASGHHFPTDVAVAAVAGTTIGITIPWLHAREPGPPGRQARLTILPFPSGHGIAIGGAF